jgi:AbrB family looped-hinge helix DNA binding protein
VTAVTTVTAKGQVTIPAFIREELMLLPRQKVFFSNVDDKVYLSKALDFFAMGGSVKTKKKFRLPAMRAAAKKLVAARLTADQ